LTLRILWVFRAVETKAAATAALGKGPYQAIVNGIRDEVPTTAPAVTSRIYQGEGVGRELSPSNSTGDARNRPTCPHQQLKKRGNKSLRWWSCLTCGARFERTDLNELPEEVPEELLREAAGSTDPITRRLATSLLQRDEHCQQALQALQLMDTEDL
jgi:hypothetical protein